MKLSGNRLLALKWTGVSLDSGEVPEAERCSKARAGLALAQPGQPLLAGGEMDKSP
jgi:hypothetical protein